ncbi:MAG: hypothetical protein ACRDF4_03205 [Rhabdochlamydiaceae bacterium]
MEQSKKGNIELVRSWYGKDETDQEAPTGEVQNMPVHELSPSQGVIRPQARFHSHEQRDNRRLPKQLAFGR